MLGHSSGLSSLGLRWPREGGVPLAYLNLYLYWRFTHHLLIQRGSSALVEQIQSTYIHTFPSLIGV